MFFYEWIQSRWGGIIRVKESEIMKDIMISCNEYPRPQMKRDSFLCLNGEWDYHIQGSNRNESGKILVPFSPESKLGGEHEMLRPDDILIEETSFQLPDGFNNGRVILHIDAADGTCEVWLNGHLLHVSECGYLPIIVDISDYLQDMNHLKVICQDPTDTQEQLRGKQTLNPKGLWYTAQSGIWQSVWLESVPVDYITHLTITPNYDHEMVDVVVHANADLPVVIEMDEQVIHGMSNSLIKITLRDMHAWSVDDPYLYDMNITMNEDQVSSYVGIRKFSVDTDENGIKRLFVNNKPYFHQGLLDQGYNEYGMLSWPNDDMMIHDILTAKAMGFNMLRKHIKIEPLRWYYHCDRLGMLVWQDMMNGGGVYSKLLIHSPTVVQLPLKDHHYDLFSRKDARQRKLFMEQLEGMVRHLYNCTSIAMWVPFNEGWGQFDSKKAVELIQSIDKTRTIDHASGWYDQKIGDFLSLHVYFRPYKFKKDQLDRCVILTECGGYQWQLSKSDKSFGYKEMTSQKELEDALEKLFLQEILPAKKQGLSACVYTQLSDVETEVNGLITYDRKHIKVDTYRLKKINDKVIND